jgi:hypothetical protein
VKIRKNNSKRGSRGLKPLVKRLTPPQVERRAEKIARRIKGFVKNLKGALIVMIEAFRYDTA